MKRVQFAHVICVTAGLSFETEPTTYFLKRTSAGMDNAEPRIKDVVRSKASSGAIKILAQEILQANSSLSWTLLYDLP